MLNDGGTATAAAGAAADDDDAAREDEPPGPQGLWKKIICGVIVVVLTLFSCLYLLLFGVQQGKAMLKVWWISSMTGLALSAICYEPFAIFVQVPWPLPRVGTPDGVAGCHISRFCWPARTS